MNAHKTIIMTGKVYE